MKNNKPQPPKSSPSAVRKPGYNNTNPNNRPTNTQNNPPAGRGNTNINANQASRQPSRQNANTSKSPPPNNSRNNNSNNSSRNPSPRPGTGTGVRRTQSNTNTQRSGSSTRANQNQNQNQNQRGISPTRTNSGGRVNQNNQNNANRNQNQTQNQNNRTSQTKNLNQNQNRNQNQNANQKPGNRPPVSAKGQTQPARQQSQTKGNSSAPARQASNKNVTFGKNATSPAPPKSRSKDNVKPPAARQNSRGNVKSPPRQDSRSKIASPKRQSSNSASPKQQRSRENLRSPGRGQGQGQSRGQGPSTRSPNTGKNVDARSRSSGSLGSRSRSNHSKGSFGVRSRTSSKDSRGSRGSRGSAKRSGSSGGSRTSVRSNSSRRSNTSLGAGRDSGRERGRGRKSSQRSSSSTSADGRRRRPYANREMRRTRSDPGDPYRYRGHHHRGHYRGRDPLPSDDPDEYRHRQRYYDRDGRWISSRSDGSFSSLKKRRSRSRSNSPRGSRSSRSSPSRRGTGSSKGSRVSFSKDTKNKEKRGKRSANRLEKKKGQEELPPVKKLDHIVQAEVGARIWHGLRLNSAHHGNYIISPCFIIIMLGLMKVGAWGKTAYEIQKSMRLPKEDDTNIEAFETFIFSLQPTEGFDLKYGMGIYSSKALMLRTPYDEEREKDWPWIAKQKFNVRIKQFDYTKKKPNVIKDLNQWVQELTDLKIKYAVSYDDVHNQPELFLVNFVYFKAVWKYVFDVDQTSMKPFYNYDNTFYNVEMMLSYINCRYAVYEDFKCRAVALPYKGDRYAMIIILPDSRTGLPDIEKLMYNLERKYHYRWKREIVPGPRDYYWRDYYKNYRMYKPFFMEIYYRLRHVHWLEVELPKFKVESKTNFVPVLQWLGTKAIFDPVKSQLGGIFEKTSKIAVDKIVQKVLIEVTEEGTGSTAVPTSRLGPTGRSFAKPVNAAFHVNHPFLFFIIDERYNAILMCGTKTNFQL